MDKKELIEIVNKKIKNMNIMKKYRNKKTMLEWISKSFITMMIGKYLDENVLFTFEDLMKIIGKKIYTYEDIKKVLDIEIYTYENIYNEINKMNEYELNSIIKTLILGYIDNRRG
ncbi:MAG: hypothetical protein ACTSO2_13720 [Promethearchaeota archaeon]